MTAERGDGGREGAGTRDRGGQRRSSSKISAYSALVLGSMGKMTTMSASGTPAIHREARHGADSLGVMSAGAKRERGRCTALHRTHLRVVSVLLAFYQVNCVMVSVLCPGGGMALIGKEEVGFGKARRLQCCAGTCVSGLFHRLRGGGGKHHEVLKDDDFGKEDQVRNVACH